MRAQSCSHWEYIDQITSISLSILYVLVCIDRIFGGCRCDAIFNIVTSIPPVSLLAFSTAAPSACTSTATLLQSTLKKSNDIQWRSVVVCENMLGVILSVKCAATSSILNALPHLEVANLAIHRTGLWDHWNLQKVIHAHWLPPPCSTKSLRCSTKFSTSTRRSTGPWWSTTFARFNQTLKYVNVANQ